MREQYGSIEVSTLQFAQAAGCYWFRVFPRVRSELRAWREQAAAITDPKLRQMAMETQRTKWGNVEGAAAFATLVAPPLRSPAIRALVSYQAAYDYADTISEYPAPARMADVAQIHLALIDALAPGCGYHDYYAYHPQRGDSGYLRALVGASRSALMALPSYETVAPLARLGTQRIIDYQTLNHGRVHPRESLAAWGTSEMPPDSDLRWWEICAAGASSLSVLALIAAAADPQLTFADAAAIEAAYFPWIGALHTLLDSLIDYPEDIAAGQYSLIEPYTSAQATASSLQRLAEQAIVRAQSLPRAHGHLLLLAGMSSLYLSSPKARAPHARPAAREVLRELKPIAGPAQPILVTRHALDRIIQRIKAPS